VTRHREQWVFAGTAPSRVSTGLYWLAAEISSATLTCSVLPITSRPNLGFPPTPYFGFSRSILATDSSTLSSLMRPLLTASINASRTSAVKEWGPWYLRSCPGCHSGSPLSLGWTRAHLEAWANQLDLLWAEGSSPSRNALPALGAGAIPHYGGGCSEPFSYGDQAGNSSSAGLLVRLIWPEPSAFIT
jgi:hypothetical protein